MSLVRKQLLSRSSGKVSYGMELESWANDSDVWRRKREVFGKRDVE